MIDPPSDRAPNAADRSCLLVASYTVPRPKPITVPPGLPEIPRSGRRGSLFADYGVSQIGEV
jgi:hypothetical protein